MRKKIVITSILSLSMLSVLGGIMSFAKGPGEKPVTRSESTVTSIQIYYQARVNALGSWEKQADNNNYYWKFKLATGGYATNCWIESTTESGSFYYISGDGVMLTNAVTPDGYRVDANGVWKKGVVTVTNTSNSPSGNSNVSETDASIAEGQVSPENNPSSEAPVPSEVSDEEISSMVESKKEENDATSYSHDIGLKEYYESQVESINSNESLQAALKELEDKMNQ